jgi:pyrophosphatase PpaX
VEGIRFKQSMRFKQVLGREPTEDEFAQLIGRPVPVDYREWFDVDLAKQILDTGTRFYQERAGQILCYSGIPELLNELKLRVRGSYLPNDGSMS